jgi:hypothetical protein
MSRGEQYVNYAKVKQLRGNSHIPEQKKQNTQRNALVRCFGNVCSFITEITAKLHTLLEEGTLKIIHKDDCLLGCCAM